MKRASTVHELHQSRAALRTCIKRSKSCADLPLLASTPADMGHARLTSFHSREESDTALLIFDFFFFLVLTCRG